MNFGWSIYQNLLLTKENAEGYESSPCLNPHQELSCNCSTSKNLQQTFQPVQEFLLNYKII